MPVYEYACDSCGKQTEAMQRISDAPLKKCPNCGKMALRRLISLSSFQLKGSGWYATDYGKNGGGGNGGKNGTAKKGDDKAADKPSETAKTETKAEPTPAKSSDD
jgi:putative FmdB family regulatory protein